MTPDRTARAQESNHAAPRKELGPQTLHPKMVHAEADIQPRPAEAVSDIEAVQFERSDDLAAGLAERLSIALPAGLCDFHSETLLGLQPGACPSHLCPLCGAEFSCGLAEDDCGSPTVTCPPCAVEERRQRALEERRQFAEDMHYDAEEERGLDEWRGLS